MGDDGAANHLVDVHAAKIEAIDQAGQRGGQHLQIAEIGIERVRAAEGNAGSADDRHLPDGLLHSLDTPNRAAPGARAEHVASAAPRQAPTERRRRTDSCARPRRFVGHPRRVVTRLHHLCVKRPVHKRRRFQFRANSPNKTVWQCRGAGVPRRHGGGWPHEASQEASATRLRICLPILSTVRRCNRTKRSGCGDDRWKMEAQRRDSTGCGKRLPLWAARRPWRLHGASEPDAGVGRQPMVVRVRPASFSRSRAIPRRAYDQSFAREWEANPPKGFPTLSRENLNAMKDAIKRYADVVAAGGWKTVPDGQLQPGSSGAARRHSARAAEALRRSSRCGQLRLGLFRRHARARGAPVPGLQWPDADRHRRQAHDCRPQRAGGGATAPVAVQSRPPQRDGARHCRSATSSSTFRRRRSRRSRTTRSSPVTPAWSARSTARRRCCARRSTS